MPTCEVVDLLANCNITNEDNEQSEVEYAEIEEMGTWHSTPLAHRHKPKISLTWVLKDNIKKTEKKIDDNVKKNCYNNRTKLEDKNYVKERIVGRNEYNHHMRFKSACDEFNGEASYSDTSVGSDEYVRKKHRHRHKRRKKTNKFGYDIRDLDTFLSEVIIRSRFKHFKCLVDNMFLVLVMLVFVLPCDFLKEAFFR